MLQEATSSSFASTASRRFTAASLARIDEFCGRARSTISSGRSDDGKNCRGTSGSARIEATNRASVTETVSHLARIPPSTSARNRRMPRPGPSCFFSGFFSSHTESSGMNSTATSHETSSAMDTTAKIENVYSPALLLAKPIGTKPAAVMKVPVSIGIATDS